MKLSDIKNLFTYKDGELYWNRKVGLKIKPDMKAGALNQNGYIHIGYQRKYYKAHRLIWIYHNGDIPNNLCIDHINGNKIDNRIENLRLANRSLNGLNNKSKGYTYCKRDNIYIVRFRHLNKNIIHKCCKIEAEAIELVKNKRNELCGTTINTKKI